MWKVHILDPCLSSEGLLPPFHVIDIWVYALVSGMKRILLHDYDKIILMPVWSLFICRWLLFYFSLCRTSWFFLYKVLYWFILLFLFFLFTSFRFIFILPYAVPSVVSMLVWKNLLNGTFGAVNRTLIYLGIIENPIPWLGWRNILPNDWGGDLLIR